MSDKAQITKLPIEVVYQIGNELGACGCQNKVPLALTCRRLYDIFRNDIVRVHMQDPICRCRIHNGPIEVTKDYWGRASKICCRSQSCQLMPLWRLLEDWSGLHGYRYCSGYHNNRCSQESRFGHIHPRSQFHIPSRARRYVPWSNLTRARIARQEAASKLLCHSLSSGLFIRCSPVQVPRRRNVTFQHSVPSTKRIRCELNRQARHCWAKEMMLAYSEWREMVGL